MEFIYTNAGIELLGLIPQTGVCCGLTHEVQLKARKVIKNTVDYIYKQSKTIHNLETEIGQMERGVKDTLRKIDMLLMGNTKNFTRQDLDRIRNNLSKECDVDG